MGKSLLSGVAQKSDHVIDPDYNELTLISLVIPNQSSDNFLTIPVLSSDMKLLLCLVGLAAVAHAGRFCPGEGRSKNQRCVADE